MSADRPASPHNRTGQGVVGFDLQRFVKLCEMLASPADAERATAARLASEMLRRRGWTWADVISPASQFASQPHQLRQPGWRASMSAAVTAFSPAFSTLTPAGSAARLAGGSKFRAGAAQCSKSRLDGAPRREKTSNASPVGAPAKRWTGNPDGADAAPGSPDDNQRLRFLPSMSAMLMVARTKGGAAAKTARAVGRRWPLLSGDPTLFEPPKSEDCDAVRCETFRRTTEPLRDA